MKKPEVVSEKTDFDEFEQKVFLSLLPVPQEVKERIQKWRDGKMELDDIPDEPMSDEEIKEMLDRKYIDDSLYEEMTKS